MIPRIGANNHVEMVHRPGEGHLARKLLTLLGCEPLWLNASFSNITYQYSRDGHLWVSEVTAGQWALEVWLQRQMLSAGEAEGLAFIDDAKATPQEFSHFGIGIETLTGWEATVARLADAATNDPDLVGRMWLASVVRPGEDGSVAKLSGGTSGDTLYQAFLRTDLISAGLLTLGQSIEIQHVRENDPVYRVRLPSGLDAKPGQTTVGD